MKSGISFCIAIVLAAGCRSTQPREADPGAIQPVPPSSEGPASVGNRTKLWRIRPVTTSQRYQITSTTRLGLAGIRDSVTSVAIIALNTQPTDTGIIFSGTIDTATLRPGSRIGNSEGLPRLPLAFSGNLSAKAVHVTAPSECSPALSSPGTLIPRIANTFPTTNLSEGLTWTDSVTFSSCNGEIPISTTAIRSFRVVGEETIGSSPAILISRSDRIQGRGNGSQDQHRVELSSSGTGSARLWISTDTGRLIQSISEFSGIVTVVSSGRQQTFNQTMIERIEARN